MRDKLRPIHKNLDLLLPLLALLIGIITMVVQGLSIQQSVSTIPMQQSFCGQYSYDRETWLPLSSETELSALDGDLYLRGNWAQGFPGNTRMYYYSNHIRAELFVNNQHCSSDPSAGPELTPTTCGSGWQFWYFETDCPEDAAIEIHLHNPHAFGNIHAYRDFLSTLCCTPNSPDVFATYLADFSRSHWVLGIVFLVASLLLLGSALAGSILSAPVDAAVPILGLLAGFSGSFFLLDTIDLTFMSESCLLNTYGWQISLMCTVYLLGLLTKNSLRGKLRKVVSVGLTVSAAINTAILLLCATGTVLIYDTLFWWFLSQCVLCPLLIGCCGVQLLDKTKENRLMLLFLPVLLFLVLPAAAGIQPNLFARGRLLKQTLILFFIYIFFRSARSAFVNYKASARVRTLEKELEESRIAITLSQIQPHFLFNVLGTLRSLCREDPEQVWRGLGDFSAYLRGNMNALTNTRFIPFDAELRHVDTYLRLEQLRLEDKLKICYDIRARDFSIPPLTLQPLVENAVKHGIFYKPHGGTVTIRATQEGQTVILSVSDDGVGFDADKPAPPHEQHAHVGLDNVRSRVEKMLRGTLRIDSQPELGTTVTLEFPITELS